MTPEQAKEAFEQACAAQEGPRQCVPIPGDLLVEDLQEILRRRRDAGFITTFGGILAGERVAVFTRPEVYARQLDDDLASDLERIRERRVAIDQELAKLAEAEERAREVHAARMALLSTGVLPWP